VLCTASPDKFPVLRNGTYNIDRHPFIVHGYRMYEFIQSPCHPMQAIAIMGNDVDFTERAMSMIKQLI
jgi:hypothetical protein